jgi:hypothetical protein
MAVRLRLLALLLIGLLTLSLLELACVAAERSEVRGLDAAPSRLFTDAVEPELPAISELDAAEPAASPVLTH